MRKKTLFLITNSYPYGKGEEFIESEIDYLCNKFENIYVVSQSYESNINKYIPKKCKVYQIERKTKLLLINPILLFNTFKEIVRNKNFSFKTILRFQYQSKLVELKIKEIIQQNNINENDITLYSYWLFSGAYAICNLKKINKNYNTVSRAHRFDLYEEDGIQPFKYDIINTLDYILPCSKNGQEYLSHRYPEFSHKIYHSYLGTINENKFEYKQDSRLIISCSYFRPVKRVDLIIEALAQFDGKEKIKWIHIGGGDDLSYYKDLARKKLSIDYEFLGHLSNKDVLTFLKRNDIKCLINLSASEGLPVSMMEVQSMGIPIIATNVGGVNEIVNSTTGLLLEENPTPELVFKGIKRILLCSPEEYIKYQQNSYENWNSKFKASKNYLDFIEKYLY